MGQGGCVAFSHPVQMVCERHQNIQLLRGGATRAVFQKTIGPVHFPEFLLHSSVLLVLFPFLSIAFTSIPLPYSTCFCGRRSFVILGFGQTLLRPWNRSKNGRSVQWSRILARASCPSGPKIPAESWHPTFRRSHQPCGVNGWAKSPGRQDLQGSVPRHLLSVYPSADPSR